MQVDGTDIQLPQAPEYLVDWLDRIGWFRSNGMGLDGISATELQAWSTGTGHALENWEFEVILAASKAFVLEHQAENFDPPDGQELPKKKLLGSLAKAFSSMSPQPQQPKTA